MTDFECVEAHLFIERSDGGLITEEEEHAVYLALAEMFEARGLTFGGHMSNYVDEDEDADAEYVPAEQICETCGGTGRKPEAESTPEAIADWNETYGTEEIEKTPS
jgi:hypothetical protein